MLWVFDLILCFTLTTWIFKQGLLLYKCLEYFLVFVCVANIMNSSRWIPYTRNRDVYCGISPNMQFLFSVFNFIFLLQIRARKLQFCRQSSSLVSSNSFFSLFMCFFPITYQNELLFAEIELMQKRVNIFALPSMFIWNIYTFFQHVILIFWLLEIRLTHFFLFRRPVQVLSAFYFKDFSA